MPFVETEYPNDAIRGGGQLDVAATAPLLNGQKVCVIGRFLAMTQADVVEVVRRHGGLLVGYPSPDTSLVVVGGDGWPCLRDGSPSPLALRVQELRLGQEVSPSSPKRSCSRGWDWLSPASAFAAS